MEEQQTPLYVSVSAETWAEGVWIPPAVGKVYIGISPDDWDAPGHEPD